MTCLTQCVTKPPRQAKMSSVLGTVFRWHWSRRWSVGLADGEVSKAEPIELADQKWFVEEWEVYIGVMER